MSALTYAELFAGAGGLSMGLETAGWEAVAHAEIEPHARAVLREHWPDCRLDGDVTQLNGADYAGVTLLSGGSPCQDLSVAGKRAGMTEGSGTRSSLFFEQVRIRNESGAPYFLWENVLGAFSSNAGRDFAAVLSALVGAPIAVPADGWESAGVAAGPTGVAAWRVLDCQFFGVPQERRRVFVLGAGEGGVDPAEVLAVSEELPGNVAAGRGSDSACLAVGDDESECLNCGVVWEPDGGLECCPICGVSQSWVPRVVRALTDGAHYGGGLNGQDATTGRIFVHNGAPRRMTPRECERVMGWPDDHTAKGIDEHGVRSHHSDSVRFRMIANGVASPVAAWIGWRLRWALEAQEVHDRTRERRCA